MWGSGCLVGVWYRLPALFASLPLTFVLSTSAPSLPFSLSVLSFCVLSCACIGAHASAYTFGGQVTTGTLFSL